MTAQAAVEWTTSAYGATSAPRIFGGAMMIAGTSIGAGMFSLPVVSAGMWFGYAILLLVVAWYCMYSSGLMLLETNLHFSHSSSFDTHTRETLGLFDYIADTFGFKDHLSGRFKTALITFAPPITLGILFPNGFIIAIGFAAVAATIFAVIIPALMVIAARRQFGQGAYRVSGGWPRLLTVILFGILVILFHLMSIAGVLPQFG